LLTRDLGGCNSGEVCDLFVSALRIVLPALLDQYAAGVVV
jgi:hypothetical protein